MYNQAASTTRARPVATDQERAAALGELKLQKPDLSIDICCSARSTGCDSALQLRWKMADMVAPVTLPGSETLWVAVLVVGARSNLQPVDSKPGFYTVSTTRSCSECPAPHLRP
jgi:hypothetical protein